MILGAISLLNTNLVY